MKILKIFNPFIWLVNQFKYQAHLESQRYAKRYEKYDFSKDMRYFK